MQAKEKKKQPEAFPTTINLFLIEFIHFKLTPTQRIGRWRAHCVVK